MTVRDDLHRMPSLPLRSFAGAIALALVATACGSDDESAQLSGVVREPAPQVDVVDLPSLSEPGGEVAFRADPGELQVVYWGFTNCPDVCPTTLADFAVALRRVGPEVAADVDLVMVTVDPDRDIDLLDRYINAFVEGSVAAGTDDEELLLAAAEPFGASWEIRTLDDGSIEVDHTPFLYVIDDQGRLLLSWQFGATSEDMATDLEILLDQVAESA